MFNKSSTGDASDSAENLMATAVLSALQIISCRYKTEQ